MSFQDFRFPQVQQDLGLAIDETDLFPDVPAARLREEFAAALADGTTLALAVNAEKAKSEFIIAPMLLELRRSLGDRLYAAQLFNQQSSAPVDAIFGVVTTGSAWKFLRLRETLVTLDLREYYIDSAGLILGILARIVQES